MHEQVSLSSDIFAQHKGASQEYTLKLKSACYCTVKHVSRDSQWAYHVHYKRLFNSHYRESYNAVATDHTTPG